MKSYSGNLALDLCKDLDSAWAYIDRRWPGAELVPSQGVGGWAFYLPGKRVLKITDFKEELDNARRVRREKPAGVVPVLSIGRHHYIMPRLVENKRGLWPETPHGVEHHDAEVVYGRSMNVMACPRTGEALFIDLDGLVFVYPEAA
jgi:hypothetical protein